ncbi:hypothetical protein JOF48_003039 [Arthrobacter stackebrandtii]|uniref:Uncharacterized protein n=1 Tax=Arthrobacter stackebrandtii TaxID=272161 RepID=A0ABS4Z0A3_9MICC|nr:hypothetical protein [Arthrobacter stackebrandtii]
MAVSVSLEKLFGLVDEDAVAGEQRHASLLAVSDLDDPAVEVCRCVVGDRVGAWGSLVPPEYAVRVVTPKGS